MARRPAPGTRQRILGVAARLFQEYGVRAVGLQQIIDETGLGKSLLYREFTSKDDLVAAWLRDSDADWWRRVDFELQRFDGDPARQLLSLVEVAENSARSPGFHGCIFYNTSSEFRDPTHPGRSEAVAHMRRLRQRLRTLASGAGFSDVAGLTDSLMIIIAGVYATGSSLGPSGPARRAVPMAQALIDLHRPVVANPVPVRNSRHHGAVST